MTEKSLKNDILFRYLFGAEHNKNILISLLNPIIELLGLPEIKDIKVINSFLEIDGIDDKKPVVDIRAVDSDGKLKLLGIHFLDYILEPDIDNFYSPYGIMHLEKACHPPFE